MYVCMCVFVIYVSDPSDSIDFLSIIRPPGYGAGGGENDKEEEEEKDY